jgi:hypothetical protein
LSDKAKEFKQLFESFQKSPSGLALAAPASFPGAMLMSASPHLSSLLSEQNQITNVVKVSAVQKTVFFVVGNPTK